MDPWIRSAAFPGLTETVQSSSSARGRCLIRWFGCRTGCERLRRGCSSSSLCSALVRVFGINDPRSSSAAFSLLSGCFSPGIDVNTAGLRRRGCYLGQKRWNLQGKPARAAFSFHHHSPSAFRLHLSLFPFSFLQLFSLLRCVYFPSLFPRPWFSSLQGRFVSAGLRARTVPILHVNKKDGWKHSGSCSGTFLLTALCYHHRRQGFFFRVWGNFGSLI